MAQGVIGYLSREETRQWQMEQLQVTLNRAYFNVDFYRRRMDTLRLLPEDISSLDDLRNFPFTTRQDLAEHYPYGLFAEPLKSIVRLKISNPAWLDQEPPHRGRLHAARCRHVAIP